MGLATTRPRGSALVVLAVYAAIMLFSLIAAGLAALFNHRGS